MKQEFCKFTVESLSASYIPFPRFLMEDCFAELTNDAKVLYALMLDRASFQGQWLYRRGRHDPSLLHRRTGTEEAAPQPTKRHTDISAAGIQRIDLPSKARSWQTCDDHAQLSFQCEADTTEGRQ